jgi:hypothetical protein
MGLLHGHGLDALSLKGRRGSNASSTAGGEDVGDGNANDTSQLDKEEGNVLMSIISQCRFSPPSPISFSRPKQQLLNELHRRGDTREKLTG